jgi:hypothetical protein
MSEDHFIRDRAHFEGFQTTESFHEATIRPIPEEVISSMKSIGYRILEFGEFDWDSVLEALQSYKKHYGDVNVPADFVITESIIESDIGFQPQFLNMTLGEAVASIRCGDIDGLEDPPRRAALDALGFDWGDLSTYQRYRFVPMMLGLRIYRHLYGFPMPMTDFVVPDEPQWPYWMVSFRVYVRRTPK